MNQKIFIAYLTSGLGNRLRPLASAMAYSVRTNRQLRVYWDQITPNGCLTPFGKLFKNDFDSISLDEIALLGNRKVGLFTEKGVGHGVKREADRFGRPQLFNISLTQVQPPQPCSALTLYDDSDVIIVYDNNYLECLPKEESIHYLRRLIPQDVIVNRVSDIVTGLGLKSGIKGVHARGTDFGIDSALELYSGLIRGSIAVDQGEQFFLSTDDALLEQGIVTAFPGQVLTRDDRLHLTLNDGKAIWTDPDSYTVSADHGIDALTDIYLLSCTNLVVYHPGSTFGEIARHLHGVLQTQGLLKGPNSSLPASQSHFLDEIFAEFVNRASSLLPRGSQPFPNGLREGGAGPEFLDQLPPDFIYWETLGYTIPIMERMFTGSNIRPYLDWDGKIFNQLAAIDFAQFPFEVFKSICPYPEAIPQLNVLKSYISNRKVLIIGSETYWLELFCAISGASEITTVEYRSIKWSELPNARSKFNTLTWDDFVGNLENYQQSYDLVLSYSSLEHSGLGRYGERSMALGDLYTFLLMTRCLKSTGMCAIAVPTGQDLTYFNAYRIYGEQRIRCLEKISGLNYIGLVSPPQSYLDSMEKMDSLSKGWNINELLKLPFGQYRQPILCFGGNGFSFEKY